VYVGGANVLSAVRDRLAPEYVASLALEDAHRAIGTGIPNLIVCEGIQYILRMTMLPFTLPRFQQQFENTHTLILELYSKPAGRFGSSV
jgi:hypothetical protein